MFFNRRKQNLADSIGNSITDLQLMFVVRTPVVGVKSVVLGTEGWGGGLQVWSEAPRVDVDSKESHNLTWTSFFIFGLVGMLISFVET